MVRIRIGNDEASALSYTCVEFSRAVVTGESWALKLRLFIMDKKSRGELTHDYPAQWEVEDRRGFSSAVNSKQTSW